MIVHFAHSRIKSLKLHFSDDSPIESRSSFNFNIIWLILVWMLLIPQTAISIEMGPNGHYHDFPNGVPGPYGAPQSVCDARRAALPDPYSTFPLNFESSSGGATFCSVNVGDCRSDVPSGSPYTPYVWAQPKLAATCPAGFTSGGNSCSNINCVRIPDTFDPIASAGEPGPGQCAGNPVNIGTGNKYQLETDLPSKGPGQIRVQRTYNSYSGTSDIYVKHWTFYYMQNLIVREYVSSTPSSVYAPTDPMAV